MKSPHCHVKQCKTTEGKLYLISKKEQRYICRKCNTDKKREYRLTDKGKAAVKRAVQKYELHNKKKRVAWDKAKYYNNKLPCRDCGSPDTDQHHPDYSQPLLTIPLCRLHHKQAHTKVT